MKKITVFYHGDCRDGVAGAWAAWKKFGNKAEYIPLLREVPSELKLRNKTIYFIDFLPRTAEEIIALKKDNKVIGLDHHVTGEKVITASDEYVYDINRSGAGIAWKYFHPKKSVPKLVSYVEDGDIWRFALPNTKEVGSWLGLHNPATIKEFDVLAKKFENKDNRKKFIEQGRLILNYADSQIDEIVKLTTTRVLFEGRKILAVNSPVYRSQIGHIIAEKSGTFGIVWVERANIIKVSLRSVKNFDVAKIAEKYGGGGHKNASSFILKKGAEVPWKVIEPKEKNGNKK